jgi:hypothetical protein
MSTNGPHILSTNMDGKIRLVQLQNGTKVIDKHDGADSLGVERWRELRFGDAENMARWMRDWVIELVRERGQEQDRERETVADTQAS